MQNPTLPRARFMQDRKIMNHSVPLAKISLTHTTCTMTGGLIILASGILTIGAAQLPGATLDSMFAILTMAGAIIASSAAFLVLANEETIRTKIGRFITAMSFGVFGPRFTGAWFSGFKDFVEKDQILMVASGFVFGGLAFLIAVALIKSVDKNAQSIVNRVLDWGASRFSTQVYQSRFEDELKKAKDALDKKRK